MLELVIVRHGESVRNHASDLAHHGDTSLLEYQLRFEREEATWDLTQRGIDQAKTAGAWIRDHIGTDFSPRFVSPFKRTLQTAACLDLPHGKWTIDQRLRERDWGDYQAPGVPPYTVSQYLADLTNCTAVDWKRPFPGSESISDMIARCSSFADDLFRRSREGRVILVTHGGTMKALQLVIERVHPNQADQLVERHLVNCSVLHYQLTIDGDKDREWEGIVRFASPTLLDAASDWQPLAGRSR